MKEKINKGIIKKLLLGYNFIALETESYRLN